MSENNSNSNYNHHPASEAEIALNLAKARRDEIKAKIESRLAQIENMEETVADELYMLSNLLASAQAELASPDGDSAKLAVTVREISSMMDNLELGMVRVRSAADQALLSLETKLFHQERLISQLTDE